MVAFLVEDNPGGPQGREASSTTLFLSQGECTAGSGGSSLHFPPKAGRMLPTRASGEQHSPVLSAPLPPIHLPDFLSLRRDGNAHQRCSPVLQQCCDHLGPRAEARRHRWARPRESKSDGGNGTGRIASIKQRIQDREPGPLHRIISSENSAAVWNASIQPYVGKLNHALPYLC
jgi:hypothetical protein